ncbi:MAG: DUF1467 family protein [Pseudomonadota bacterium]
MSWPILIGLYFILWWTILFAVLPWGVTSQHEAEDIVPGSDPGAPVKPMLLKKALWTSMATAILVGVIYLAVTYRLISV